MTDDARAVLDRVEQIYRDRTPTSSVRHAEALKYLPGGDTRESTFFRPYPLYMERGLGSQLWDVDGNGYVDFHGNHTCLIHGHAHPVVTNALRQQLERGTLHGAPTTAITELAALLVQRIPSVERVRFTTSGTEAVMQAIRVARAVTGRSRIMKMEGAYHGSYDGTEVSVKPGPNVPSWPIGRPESPGLPASVVSDVLVAPYNDAEVTCDLIRRHARELAALIVEPMMGRGAIPATPQFLAAIHEETRRHGIVLIFDEIQTFRLAHGGGQSLYEVQPDLTTLGKLIGGGMPVGAFGGRADIMARFDPGAAHHVPHSGTFNANAMTMAAGIATLQLLTETEIARINQLGEQLREGLQSTLDLAGVRAAVTGLGSYAWIHFTAAPVHDARAAARSRRDIPPALHLALLNRGIFAADGVRFVVSTCMTEAEIAQAVKAVASAMDELAPLVHQGAETAIG